MMLVGPMDMEKPGTSGPPVFTNGDRLQRPARQVLLRVKKKKRAAGEPSLSRQDSARALFGHIRQRPDQSRTAPRGVGVGPPVRSILHPDGPSTRAKARLCAGISWRAITVGPDTLAEEGKAVRSIPTLECATRRSSPVTTKAADPMRA